MQLKNGVTVLVYANPTGQIYFGKGVNLWRGFATYRFLIIVENSPLKQQ